MKKLIFVTSNYPYGSGETFIENEIEHLSKAFDKIFIYSTEAHSSDKKRPVPDNVTVFAADPKSVSKKDYIPCLFKPSVIKEIFGNCLGKFAFAKISACCYFSANVKKQTKSLNDFVKLCDITADDSVTVYSYWLSTVGMCAVRILDRLEKSGISTKLVSRCHGFDVYKERSEIAFLPFQEYMIARFERVLPCSKNGENYLRKLYPQFSEKINVAYLGVKDSFNGALPKKEESFNVVSCSNVIPIKRVNLIIEGLAGITDKSISWTHFGDGEQFEKTKALAKEKLPANIKYEFKGRIPNPEIYDFYNKNNVNLFINVSESEGLPVSIMEAISFGIPVIATDVGGTSEIVTDGKNGFSLKKDFETNELADMILRFCEMDKKEYSAFCETARNTYIKKFEAEKNFSAFVNIISS